MSDLRAAEKALAKAHRQSLTLAARRGGMENATRAAVTRANAAWARVAEDRDRLIRRVEDLGGDPRRVMQDAATEGAPC